MIIASDSHPFATSFKDVVCVSLVAPFPSPLVTRIATYHAVDRHIPSSLVFSPSKSSFLFSETIIPGSDAIWQLKVMELLGQHAPPSFPSCASPHPRLARPLQLSAALHSSPAHLDHHGQPPCDPTTRQRQGHDDVNGSSPRFCSPSTNQIGSESPLPCSPSCPDASCLAPSCLPEWFPTGPHCNSQPQSQSQHHSGPYTHQHHDVSGVLPLSVTAGKWRSVFRELVQLDREWKFPPLLPVRGTGCSSAEDGWGVDYTTGDDFFWFSKVQALHAYYSGTMGRRTTHACALARVTTGVQSG